MSVLPPVIPSVATQTQCFKVTCSVNEEMNELHVSHQDPFRDVRESSEKQLCPKLVFETENARALT